MNVKKHLKTLLAKGELKEVFEFLRSAFPVSSEEYNALIINLYKYKSVEEDRLKNAISIEEYNRGISQILGVLTKLVDLISSDLLLGTKGINSNQGFSNTQPLQDYHKFTCDRVVQNDHFHKGFRARIDQKVHFFYMYGLEQHSHMGLFKRFTLDLEGQLQKYLDENEPEESCKVIKRAISFDESHDVEVYKRNVLKALFSAVRAGTDEHTPFQKRSLNDLVKASRDIKRLGTKDFVCVFFSFIEYDIQTDIIPEVVDWFISQFCDTLLPAETPSLLFFFGMIYEEYDAEAEAELQKALNKKGQIKILPELNMVSQRDIKRWLAKYKGRLNLSTEDRDRIITEYFSDKDEFYMEKVEHILTQIIIKHNQRFYI